MKPKLPFIIGSGYRDENAEALIMLLVAAAAGGIVLVFLVYMGYKLFRRYVLKIQEPGKNFVVDKKVKCRSGRYEYHDSDEGEDGDRKTPNYEV